MLKVMTIVLLFSSFNVFSFSSGSGTCIIDADYDSITAMTDRRKNFNSGPFTVSTNVSYYTQGEPVEITITGTSASDTFIGILFTLVDESGQNVGTFAPDGNVIHDCFGANQTSPPGQAVTHGGGFNMTSYTLFWIPPANNVGKTYILGYILKGPSSQEFFRFVRDDNSAVSLNARDVFSSGFE